MEQITAKEVLKKHFGNIVQNSTYYRDWDSHEKNRPEVIENIILAMEEYASLRSVSETKFAPIQLCPKCNGSGKIPSQFDNSVTETVCDVCNGAKTLIQMPVPVSEVGQMEEDVQYYLNELSKDINGCKVGFDNDYEIAEAHKTLNKLRSLLPVPNTKTVEGETYKNELPYPDSVADKIAEINNKQYDREESMYHLAVFIYNRLRSNEPERKDKIIVYSQDDLDIEPPHKTEGKFISLSDHLRLMSESNPSPPLKALSEITDEDYLEIAILNGYFGIHRTAKNGKRDVDYIFNETGVFEIEDEVSSMCAIKVYQYLQHKGYAVPVFYPVPEVKEKGETT